MNRQPDYMIYPSILDAWTRYRTSEGMTEEELLARINRTGGTSPEAMRGTAFNEVIDRMAAGYIPELYVDGARGDEHYLYNYERERYAFPRGVCDRMAALYRGSLTQQFVQGDIECRHGVVRLYGYADGVFPRSVRDIKTTKRYAAQKYRNSWQKVVYPYCVRQMGGTVDEFVFDVTDFDRVYTEVYTGRQIDISGRIGEIDDFIDYLERRRDLITQPKLFGIRPDESNRAI